MERAENLAKDHHPIRAVVVLGVSGSGKSTVAKRLAPAIAATFLEGDDYHTSANIAKMRSGQPLTDADREPWLATLGHAVGEHCRGGRSVVLACSALRRSYRDALAEAARRELIFIHLTIPPAILEARVKVRHEHFMPASLLQSQLDTLEPLQPDEDGTAIAETGTAQRTVEAIRRWLHRHAAGELEGPKGGHEKGRHRRPSLRERAPPPKPIRPAT